LLLLFIFNLLCLPINNKIEFNKPKLIIIINPVITKPQVVQLLIFEKNGNNINEPGKRDVNQTKKNVKPRSSGGLQ
jgi:hypothetical protein